MTLPNLLCDIDSLLALLEDSAHGEDARQITEMRGRIQKAIEDSACEFCNGNGGKEINREGHDVPVDCAFCDATGVAGENTMKFEP